MEGCNIRSLVIIFIVTILSALTHKALAVRGSTDRRFIANRSTCSSIAFDVGEKPGFEGDGDISWQRSGGEGHQSEKLRIARGGGGGGGSAGRGHTKPKASTMGHRPNRPKTDDRSAENPTELIKSNFALMALLLCCIFVLNPLYFY